MLEWTCTWLSMIADIKENYRRNEVPFGLMQQLGKTPKKKVQQLLVEK